MEDAAGSTRSSVPRCRVYRGCITKTTVSYQAVVGVFEVESEHDSGSGSVEGRGVLVVWVKLCDSHEASCSPGIALRDTVARRSAPDPATESAERARSPLALLRSPRRSKLVSLSARTGSTAQLQLARLLATQAHSPFGSSPSMVDTLLAPLAVLAIEVAPFPPRATIHSLPPEIVHHIIKLALPILRFETSNERYATLRACCLVCKGWRELAGKELGRHLVLGYPRDLPRLQSWLGQAEPSSATQLLAGFKSLRCIEYDTTSSTSPQAILKTLLDCVELWAAHNKLNGALDVSAVAPRKLSAVHVSTLAHNQSWLTSQLTVLHRAGTTALEGGPNQAPSPLALGLSFSSPSRTLAIRRRRHA